MLETLLATFTARISEDHRVLGVLVAGSFAAKRLDRFSDLDLVIVSNDADHRPLLSDSRDFAGRLGDLLAAFTGEHVGEPRLLICLYAVEGGDGLAHVDLKFVTPSDLATRVDDPVVLYDPTGVCAATLAQTQAVWPERSPQWFEDRAWIWLHYGAARLGRGERLEAASTLDWFRSQVLAPMAARNAGKPQRGVRRLEEVVPTEAARLSEPYAASDAESLWQAFERAAADYVSWRAAYPPGRFSRRAEELVLKYIAQLRTEKP